MSVFIIAEAGVNHNGSFELAKKLCDVAKKAGADAIKFQTFKTEKLLTKKAILADYQKNSGVKSKSQYEMIKELELSFENFGLLKNYCDQIGIEFMSTPDDEDSLEFLVNIGVKRIKIGSAEITNVPFLRKLAKTKLPLILSTGMSTLEEVKFAIKTILDTGFDSKNLICLHCNSEYPTPIHDVNMLAMMTIKKECNIEIGYSDHTLGNTVCVAATALGAKALEKHFTLDKNMSGPDHKASLDPQELENFIAEIRMTEACLGSAEKIASPSEAKNKSLARRYIVASTQILKGTKFTEDNLTTKRTSSGIGAHLWDEVIGQIAQKDYEEDESI